LEFGDLNHAENLTTQLTIKKDDLKKTLDRLLDSELKKSSPSELIRSIPQPIHQDILNIIDLAKNHFILPPDQTLSIKNHKINEHPLNYDFRLDQGTLTLITSLNKTKTTYLINIKENEVSKNKASLLSLKNSHTESVHLQSLIKKIYDDVKLGLTLMSFSK
jgi:hypothetical protein